MNIRELINKIDEAELDEVAVGATNAYSNNPYWAAKASQAAPVATTVAADVGKEASVMSKMWGGIKGFFGKAALPIAIAAEIWDGWESIQAIPVDTPETEYRAQVTKIVTNLVANFGLFWVGSIIGGAIAGAVTGGAGALAGFIGGGVGGMAASYFLGEKGIDQLINAIVDHVYDSKAHVGKDGKGPNGEPLVKNPRTGQMGYWKKHGRSTDFITIDPSTLSKAPDAGVAGQTKWPTTDAEIKSFQQSHGLVADGLIGKKTLAALKDAGATPPQGFIPVPDKRFESTHLAENLIKSFGY